MYSHPRISLQSFAYVFSSAELHALVFALESASADMRILTSDPSLICSSAFYFSTLYLRLLLGEPVKIRKRVLDLVYGLRAAPYWSVMASWVPQCRPSGCIRRSGCRVNSILFCNFLLRSFSWRLDLGSLPVSGQLLTYGNQLMEITISIDLVHRGKPQIRVIFSVCLFFVTRSYFSNNNRK